MELKPEYKLTEAGVIPEDWNSEKLGNFIALQRGHDLTWRERRNGEVPVIGSAGHNGFHDVAIARGPGVVLGRSGASFGQAHYCEQDFWPHNTALYVTDFRGNDPLFVFYFLTAFDFSRHNSGGAQQSLNRNFIAPLPIGVPPPPEQRLIATALSDMDELLGALDRLIAKKRDLKQAAMQQLLTSKTRLPGFGEGKGYKQTEVGEIPEDWNIHILCNLCSAIVDGTHYTPSYVPDGIPFYSVENVTADDFQNTKFISEQEHLSLIKRCKPEKGDILLTRIGSLGVTRLIDWEVNASIYVSLALLKLNARAVPEYVYTYSKSRQFIKDVEKRSLINATPQKINMEDIGKVPILIPQIQEEQRSIATILFDMDAEIAILEQRRDKTRALKQAMMQELLTGRIRLV
jgi:type I restriction enzyme S subunit